MPVTAAPLKAGRPLATPSFGWQLLRANATEDQAAAHDLTADNLDWSDIIINVEHAQNTDGIIDIRSFGKVGNGVDIAFFTNATDAANDTFDFELIAYKEGPYGPGKHVFLTSGNQCIVGTHDCKKHPTLGTAQSAGLWVDTIAGTDCWPSGVVITDTAVNRIAVMSFDMRGFRYLYLNVFNAGGTGTEAATIGCIITAY